MGVPISQMWTVATYVLGQKLRSHKRYPLVLMLEPLFRCNLACAGCGKIQYPAHVLKRQLTPEEWRVMKTHVEKGARILEPLTDFKKVREIIMAHHERFDGSGYPRGLKGDEISIEARIICVVDSFHAIVSSRCYREGKSIDSAIHEMRNCAGTQFDPVVVDAFLRALKKDLRRQGENPGALAEYVAD